MFVVNPDYILGEYGMTSKSVNLEPTKIDLFERDNDESVTTGTNGCVVCPSTTPAGPTCGPGQERLLRAQTCSQCPEYYCDDIDSDSNGGGAPVGAIVGGVVGGVAAIAIAGLLYFFLVWKKKHPSLDDDEDIIMSQIDIDHDDKGSISNESKTENSDRRVSSGGTVTAAGAALERPGARKTNSNRRLSSYESFTRPQAKFKGKRVGPNGRPIGQRQLKSRNLINNSNLNSPYMDPNSSNRNSIATTISTTNASNILPIAYIPGVTVRPTKNNTKSIYSYETDSIFSDLNTIENASIIGDIMRANYNNQENQNNETNNDNTMTAIKAQPRLVNVDRIEEEEEEEEELDNDDDYSEGDGEYLDDSTEIGTSNSKSASKSSIMTSTHHVNDSTLSNIADSILEEDDSDSDVDSDFGEIQRATSITRNRTQVRQVDNQSTREIPLDLIDLGKPSKGDDRQSLNDGSFVLDVEIDNNERPQSQTSGEKSPFEDP